VYRVKSVGTGSTQGKPGTYLGSHLAVRCLLTIILLLLLLLQEWVYIHIYTDRYLLCTSIHTYLCLPTYLITMSTSTCRVGQFPTPSPVQSHGRFTQLNRYQTKQNTYPAETSQHQNAIRQSISSSHMSYVLVICQANQADT